MVDAQPGETASHRSAPQAPFIALLSLGSLGLAVTVFLAISLHQLTLPGLYYDEALDLVPMLQVMHGEQADLLRGIGLTIGHTTLPIMLMDYMGSLNGYLSLPFMALLGPGVVAARVEPIFFSALTVILAYALARAWFGRGVAAVTALLLGINPSFIWFSRQGISVTSVMTVFSLGSALLIDRWLRLTVGDWRLRAVSHSQSPVSNLPLLAAGLLLGLGLWAKLIFLWWIVALGAMALVWIASAPRNAGRRIMLVLHASLWVLMGLLAGAAPLLYYNLHDLLRAPFDLRNAYTLDLLIHSANQTTNYGVNNLDLWANLKKALADFKVFLDGSYFWYNGVPYSNVYAVPAFLISLAVGSALALGYRRQGRRWLALLAAIAATVFVSAFTVSGLWATHLFIMVPLPQMVVACAAVWLAGALVRGLGRVGDHLHISAPPLPLPPARLLTGLLVVGLLALPAWRDVWVSVQQHATLARTGGSGRFSDAIYRLAAHLDAQHITAPIALDWGIEKSVRVLTDDRVRPQEVFGFTPEPDDTFRNRVRELLQDPSREYIVLWDRFAVYNRRQAFTQIANSMGKQVSETYIAHERSGLPVYVMLQAK